MRCPDDCKLYGYIYDYFFDYRNRRDKRPTKHFFEIVRTIQLYALT